jgi:hypothetical protein
MIVISDIHGNYPKLEAFLNYRPDVEHGILGDFFDSYHATDSEMLRAATLAFESGAELLMGNHDLQYLNNTHREMKCSGMRYNEKFVGLMEQHKYKLQASLVRDDYLLTHAGAHPWLIKDFDTLHDVDEYLNSELFWYVSLPSVPETLPPIFNIGSCRGGWHQFGGIFWLDYRKEKVDRRFNQVFGHNHGPKAKIIPVGKQMFKNITVHVCVDAPGWYCFNTKTGTFEDFMLPEFKDDIETRKMLEVTF